MLDITNFGLFFLSVFLLCVTPGPDMAYVVVEYRFWPHKQKCEMSAPGTGCVKTFLAVETAKNRAENRAHT
jgi:hypothetical protein